MKILKKILLVLISLVALVYVASLFFPKVMTVERSIDIGANYDIVYEQVKYLQAREAWSPWAELDTNMITELIGTDGEVGAVITWDGNDDAGAGKQEITAIRPDQIDVKITFTRPFESVAETFIKLESGNDKQMNVVWGFASPTNRPLNMILALMGFEKSRGQDYEKGLAKLKELCEAKQKQYDEYNTFQVMDMSLQSRMLMGTTLNPKAEDWKMEFNKGQEFLYQHFLSNKFRMNGFPGAMIILDEQDLSNRLEMTAYFPIEERLNTGVGMSIVQTPPMDLLMTAVTGDYRIKVPNALKAIQDHAKATGVKLENILFFEIVKDEKNTNDIEDWSMFIYWKRQDRTDEDFNNVAVPFDVE